MKFGLWILAGAWGLSAFAAVETDREVARTFANFYLSQKKPMEARRVLQEHLAVDAQDAASWNLAGLLQLKDRDAAGAEQSFRAALKATKTSDPDYGAYLYNLADSFSRQRKKSLAFRALKRAKLFASVSGSAETALDVYADGEALPPLHIVEPGKWSGSLSLKGGYDTNVLLFSDVSYASASPSDTASPFAQLSVRGTYRKETNALGMMTLKGLAFGNLETASVAQTFTSALASIGAEFGDATPEDPGFGWSWGVEGLGMFMNSDGIKPYLVNGQAFFKGALRHTAVAVTEVEIPVRYQLYFQAATTAADDIRNGLAGRAKFQHVRWFGSHKVSVGVGYELQLTSGKNFKSHELAAPIAWTFPIAAAWTGNVGGELGRTWYPENTQSRLDTFWKVGGGVTFKVNAAWTVAVDYQYRRNVSNLSTATYVKHQGTGALTYAF